jgi:transposase-like protein
MKAAEDLNLVEITRKFPNPKKARQWFEKVRWPDGPVCPHCKGKEVKRVEQRKESKSPGRAGLFRCRGCDGQFTVTKGTIFEDSHIGLDKWMMAIFLMCSSKKGMSAHQLHRMLGVTYKTAWFMAHRIRHAMSDPDSGPLSGVVEIDETYVGGKPRPVNNDTAPKKRGRAKNAEWKKTPVVALVQRDGSVKTRVIANVTAKTLNQFIKDNLDGSKQTTVNTDNFVLYCNYFKDWEKVRHEMVNHSQKEYARVEADGSVSHTNTAESFFSLIKRGVYGTFHHVSREHLFRYCNEFGFRWDKRKLTDGERMESAFEMTEGKRLTYRDAV